MVSTFDELKRKGVNTNTLQALMNPGWPQYEGGEIEVTFDGATENGIGDESGSQNPYTLATVTGLVEMSIFARCSTSLTGAGSTVEVGTATSTANLIALTTATDIVAKEIWHDASPDASIELTSVILRKLVAEDVKITTKTADTETGVITFVIRWSPITSDGNVVVT